MKNISFKWKVVCRILLLHLLLHTGFQLAAQDTDTDQDGISNATDLDDDNDGIPDSGELLEISAFKPPCGNASIANFSSGLILTTGTDKQVGAVYRISNVIAGIDALVEIESMQNISDIVLDDNGISAPFSPQTTALDLPLNEEAFTQYGITFVESGTSTPVIIGSMYANIADIDGNSSSGGDVVYFSGHASYSYAEPTNFTIVNSVYDENINWTKITSGTTEVSGSDTTNKSVAATARFANFSSFRIRAGVIARQDLADLYSKQLRFYFTCILNYSNPVTFVLDFDEDGIANALDLDSDNDGIADLTEAGGSDDDNNAQIGTGTGSSIADANLNGLASLTDPGDGGVALVLTNTDGDFNPNFLDIDSDGDGIPDLIEGQSTATFQTLTDSDDDGDGVDNVFDQINGHGADLLITPVDNDEETPDFIDLNSDADNENDAIEGWDSDNNGVADVVPDDSDSDGDGLDNAYDVIDYAVNPSNGKTPASFPNTKGTAEPDWRQPYISSPTANPDYLTVAEDNILELNPVIFNDISSDDGPSATEPFSITDFPSNGNLIINDNGTPAEFTDDIYSYNPSLNFYGTDTFIYRICDADGSCDTALVTITVTPVNDAPVAISDSTKTNPGQTVSINVALNDSDVDPETQFSFTVLSNPDGSTAVIDPVTGDLTYTPVGSGLVREDVVTYQICDNGTPQECNTAQVVISVPSDPEPPVPADDNAITSEDVSVEVDVVANDNDPNMNLDEESVQIVTDPLHGTVSISASTGVISYIPHVNFSGKDSLEYTICDTTSLCANAKVVITVNEVNDAPVANDDLASSDPAITTNINIGENDTDVDAVTVFTFELIDNPAGTTAELNPQTGILTYTPSSSGSPRQDTIRYRLCDDGDPVLCSEGQLLVTIPDEPVAPIVSDDALTVNEDTPGTVKVIINDRDVNGDLDSSSVVVKYDPNNGTTVVNAATGEITYTPDADFNGRDTLTYTICDNASLCSDGEVFITVTSVNDFPVANYDSTSANPGVPVTIDISNNDYDVDAGTVLDYVIFSKPDQTTASLSQSGVLTYTPSESSTIRTDSIYYQVCDNAMPTLCATTFVLVTVPIPDTPPVAVNDQKSTSEDTPALFDLLENDSDVNNNINPTSLTIITNSKRGISTVNPQTGIISYFPNNNYNGSDSIRYRVCDLTAKCDTAKVYITITAVNDRPVTDNEVHAIDEDTQANGDVTGAGDVDPEGTALTVGETVKNPAFGELIVDQQQGTYVYTPSPDYNGRDTIVIKVCDQGIPAPGVCSNDTIFIEVLPVNDSPVATDVFAEADPGTATTISLSSNVSDPDAGTVFSYGILSYPSGTLASVNQSTGVLIFTPSASETTRTDTVRFNVCDNAGECSTARVLVAVPDRTFRAKDDSVTIDEDGQATVFVLVNDTAFHVVDTTSLAVTKAPLSGSAVVNQENGSIAYTPGHNFNGFDTITYTICKKGVQGECRKARVFIAVSEVNDLEVVNDKVTAVVGLSAVSGNFIANNIDPEGTAIVATQVVADAVYGKFNFFEDGGFTYSPYPNAPSVADVVIVQVCDNGKPAPGICKNDTIIFALVQNMFISEGFTPNGDGINDYFIVETIIPGDIQLKVFNRWGDRVFESNNYQNDWSGRTNSNLSIGEELPAGTYFYQIRFGNGEVATNYVTILK